MIIHCPHDAMVSVKELKPHPKNHNSHPKEQIERLAKILEFQGWRYPIKVSKRSGLITSGHGRLEAAKLLKLKEVPVSFQDYTDEAQEYADLTADNAIASWSELDLSGINSDMLDLGPDFDIDLLGIKDFVIEPIEKLEPQCDEDEVPDALPEPKVVKGEVYILGKHRLMCGDSTAITDVERLMDGKKADMVFTSPPYNANTRAGDGDIFTSKKMKKLYAEGYSDNLESKEYVDFARSVLEVCFMVTEGFIFWNVSYNANSRFEYIKQIEGRLENLIEQICWKKTSTIPFKGSLMRDWEPIYLFSTNGEKLGLNEVVSNHWQISNTNSQQENHKACFPVELPTKGIGLIKKKSGIVFEPFCGSGSTLIASEKVDRACYGMELDPHYCGVILDRWQKFTGKKAHREDGVAWDEIKAGVSDGPTS
jgi:DNA modification methylase